MAKAIRTACTNLISEGAGLNGKGGVVIESHGNTMKHSMASWYNSPAPGLVFNHESRSHMSSDLHRYMFASVFAQQCKFSPNLGNFPFRLLPNHANANRSASSNNLFTDRFRVQAANTVGSTVTSHISKDGHGFIHYDPTQCRSLTVREAARIQTFPDDYCFLGSRTAQYHPVGNAVPPYLAYQIAETIAQATGGLV